MRSLGGLNKDRKRSGDLMRGRGTASRSAPAKRQPIGSCSPIVSNDNGDCSGGDGVDANDLMVRRKKEKVKVSRWRLSNNHALPSGEAGSSRSEGEGEPFRPILSTTSSTSRTSRKRVRLNGKVVEDPDAVDPAPVPRKLRSAINKCGSQSSSLIMPDVKKKHFHTSNGFQLLYGNGGRRCKQMLLGSLTKDEEEVVEALCALYKVQPLKEQIPDKEEKRVLEDHQDNNATSTTNSETLKVADKDLMQQCTASGIKNTSSCVEKTSEETIDKHSSSKQPVTICGIQTIDSVLNKTPELGGNITSLSEIEKPENTLRNLIKFSRPSGALSCYTGNRVLQPTQCDAITALPPCKSHTLQQNGCVESAAPGHEVQQAEHNNGSSAKLLFREGTVRPHVQPPSSNSAVWPGPHTSAASLTSSEVDVPTKKVPVDVTSSWKKCAIHVFIGHLIKSYQEKEKQHTMLLQSENSKSRNGSKLCVWANNERDGLQSGSKNVASAALNGSIVERNKHEGRNESFCNGRFMPANQSPVLSEAQKNQTCDFLPLSAGGDTGSSEYGAKTFGQLHSPFLHAHVPHHSLVPIPFSHVPYAPSYPEKLASAATQQVQLQVPHYVGNPFYGPQMENTISNIQLQQQYQQQQIWQAHFAHYRSPVGVALLQNERLHDPSASLLQNAQASSTHAPSLSIQIQGGSYQPQISQQRHQLLANASSSSSSKAKRHQHQQLRSLHGSRFHHEGLQSVAASLQPKTLL